MPELPEVETTCRGIRPLVQNQTIQSVKVRNPNLRYPVSNEVCTKTLKNQVIKSVDRRGKYILLRFDHKSGLMIHLGMSGSLKICTTSPQNKPQRHDHFDIVFNQGQVLRFNDPRRFGCVLWADNFNDHPRLNNLGFEPLSTDFNGKSLYRAIHNKKTTIKSALMNSQLVTGVGNIYVAEALFLSRIHPQTLCKDLSQPQCTQLVKSIKQTLEKAIKSGGTTLKDFSNAEGKPGYFQQELQVYGRAGEPCLACGTAIIKFQQNQRSSFCCPRCQVV